MPTGQQLSRFDIIDWVNDTLLIHMTKIQQLGSGAIYCHLLDAAYPERIALNKVKWDAKLQVDFLHNFKILQGGLEILNIEKNVEVEKLVKAKFQDNLQFIQWMHGMLAQLIEFHSNDYQPLKRRMYAKIYLDFVGNKNVTKNKKVNVTLNGYTSKQTEILKSARFKENDQSSNVGSAMKSSLSSINSVRSFKSVKSIAGIKPVSSLAYNSKNKLAGSSVSALPELKQSFHDSEDQNYNASFSMAMKKSKKTEQNLNMSSSHNFSGSSYLQIYKKKQTNNKGNQLRKIGLKKHKGGISVSSVLSSNLKSRAKNNNENICINMVKNVPEVQSDQEQDPFAII